MSRSNIPPLVAVLVVEVVDGFGAEVVGFVAEVVVVAGRGVVVDLGLVTDVVALVGAAVLGVTEVETDSP